MFFHIIFPHRLHSISAYSVTYYGSIIYYFFQPRHRRQSSIYRVLEGLPQVGSRRLPGIWDMDDLYRLWQNIHYLWDEKKSAELTFVL